MGAEFIFTIGERYHKQPSDTPNTELYVPLLHFIDWEDFTKHVPSKSEIVCIEMTDKATELQNVFHPERAVYVLGAEDYGIPEEYMKGHQTIVIPSKRSSSYNVAVAGSIVMYDRMSKLGVGEWEYGCRK